MLGMIAENLATGVTRTVQWHEVEDELTGRRHRRRRAHTRAEFAARHAARVRSTSPSTSCATVTPSCPRDASSSTAPPGQRGHVAARLLTQLGHDDVVNLDGGLRTWQPPTRCWPAEPGWTPPAA